MATVVPGLVDRMIALLEGTQSNVTRSIPTNRFEHVPFEPEYALPNSAAAPYPFEIEDLGEFQPLDVPSTLAPDQIWHGCRFDLRVGYATSPHDQKERFETIQTDRHAIRRCLGDPDSWNGATGFSRVVIGDTSTDPVEVPGSDQGGEPEMMLVLTVPVELTYREDHSS